MFPFDKKKLPVQISLDPVKKAPKPKDISGDIPSIDGTERAIKIAEYASAIGISAEAMKNPYVFETLGYWNGRFSKSLITQAKEQDVCPLCFSPGCPWPDSEEARLMGWGGVRTRRGRY